MSSLIKFCLKTIFAGGLIYWLVSRGELDFVIVLESLNHKTRWSVCLLFLFFNIVLISWRWRLLLEIRSPDKIPYLSVFKIVWIGGFFTKVLPISLAGEAIKALYVKRLKEESSVGFVLASIFIDRMMGLVSLVLLQGIFSIIFFRVLFSDHSVSTDLVIVSLCTFGVTVILGLIVLQFHQMIALFLRKSFQNVKILTDNRILFKHFDNILEKKRILFYCLLISLLSQSLNVIAFWVIAVPFCSSSFPVYEAFFMVPIGLIVVAMPLTPSGIGTGHLAFGFLLESIGIENGINIYNIFMVGIIFINLLGGIPYVFDSFNRK